MRFPRIDALQNPFRVRAAEEHLPRVARLLVGQPWAVLRNAFSVGNSWAERSRRWWGSPMKSRRCRRIAHAYLDRRPARGSRTALFTPRANRSDGVTTAKLERSSFP